MYTLSNILTSGTIIISIMAYILFALYVIGSVAIAIAIYINVAKSYINHRKEIKLIQKII